ncbi:MAG TPA: extracellular solute-binding protein, partial [Arachnia sp.]|nr:extracellular solute-binding protein [Arachnia sp.]
MKFTLSAVALASAAAIALTACGGGTPNTTPETTGGTTPATSEAPAPQGGEIRVWLVGTDTPQAARDYLTSTFEKENAGSKLVIEEQQWTGLVDKLTTSLSSNDSPDIVEMGNTQAPAFTSAGALADLSGIQADLGGDDLLSGFVEAGSWDGKLY